MSSFVVAVAGGSGGLGRAIVEGLKGSARYVPVILSRSGNPKLEEEAGVRVLAVDYSNADELARVFEENNVWAVISVLRTVGDIVPEVALIQAADKAKSTQRFIPNIWSGIEYKEEHVKAFPPAAIRTVSANTLAKTNLQWTRIYPGIFLEYYAQNLPSFLQKLSVYLDVEERVAGIPGSGNVPVSFSYSLDIGRYVTALLGLDKWEEKYFIAGDTKTWNQAIEIIEKVKGVKIDVTYDSVEKLKQGQVTDLPGYQVAAEYLGGGQALALVHAAFALMGLWTEEGLFKIEGAKSLHEVFPEIKAIGLEEALRKA